MKKIIFLLLLVLMSVCAANAEESARDMLSQADIGNIQSFSERNEAGVNANEIAEGVLQGKVAGIDEISEFLKRQLSVPLRNVAADVAGTIAPVLLLAVLGSVFPNGEGGSGGARFVLAVSLIGLMAETAVKALQSAQDCLRIAKEFTDMIAPVLSALITAAGMNGSAALISPSSALAGNIIEGFFNSYGMIACRCALVLACAGSLSAAVDLSAVVSMLKKGVNWCCGLASALFAALIAVQNNVAATADNAALRTAKYTVDSFSAIIGNGVSDAWNTYVSGISIAKNAIGVSGSAVLLAAGIKPIAEILLSMLALNLIAVLLKVVGEKSAARASEQISGVCQMALALCCGSIVIAAILLSATIFAGNRLVY